MLLINDSKILSNKILEFKKLGRKINFIPTMGNLHLGHLELVRMGKKNDGINLVSIFINPLQFNDENDFRNYPRTFERDKKLLLDEDVDLLFSPLPDFVLNQKQSFDLGNMEKKLCGKFRKGHFEGVSSVIIKFLKLINPDFIFLGEKDFQQILIIKKIIRDLNFNVGVKVIPTVRDKNNIALSSRNKLLKKDISLAVLIPDILYQIISEIENGNFQLSKINKFKDYLIEQGIQEVEYLEILKERDLNMPNDEFDFCRIFIAVKIQGIRLIDNMRLEKEIKIRNGKYLLKSF